MSSYSPSPYRLPHILSPARSTPSLDDNLDDTLYLSPPETYLDTPDLHSYDWREIRKLEDRRLFLEEHETASLGLYVCLISCSFSILSLILLFFLFQDVDLPSLSDVSSNKAPLPSEVPPAPVSWHPSTISPAEAFYDYEEVRRFMAEQARPSSPSVYSVCSSYLFTPYNEPQELPSIDDDGDENFGAMSYPFVTPSPEVVLSGETPPATKRPRDETDDDDFDACDDSDPSPKRGRFSKRRRSKYDDVADSQDPRIHEFGRAPDDDDSGEFHPRAPHPNKKNKTIRSNPRRTLVKSSTPQKPHVKPRLQTHGKAEDLYRLGPCECKQPGCASCEMTCWYTFIRGPREGQVCRRLFESGRHLDLRRHKISHAVNEWQMLENGEITLEEARWYAVEHNCEHQGLICPNGDCTTTFTRYDALRRHMERQTCPYWHRSSYPNLDSRSVKAQIERDSKEKYARISASKQT